MRRLSLAAVLFALALPALAQDGPRVIDVDGGGTTFFPSNFDDQLSAEPPRGEPLVISMQPDVATDAPAPLDALTEDAIASGLPPVSAMRQAGATRIEMLDRCAAFESSLVTVIAAKDLAPQTAQRHRDRFTEFTQAVIAERRAAGLPEDEAEAASREAILTAAHLYLDTWEDAYIRTGSYLGTPLRRLDTLACAALLEGAEPVERASLNEQLGLAEPVLFGVDE